MNLVALVIASLLSLARASLWNFRSTSNAYSLVNTYDASNWYSSFEFQQESDPTSGFVNYISLADAQSQGLTKIINGQVFMGVDNTTVLPSSATGRNSIWIISQDSFMHGLLIGDFAHIPGSDCGTWPAFWTIRTNQDTYGEIDIIESYNDATHNYMTLHTGGQCTFLPVSAFYNLPDCNLNSSPGGCTIQGPNNSYGTGFNANGGGVYAMEKTSSWIRIWFWAQGHVPADVQRGNPAPSTWGVPAADFDASNGNCDIDANFPAQTIYFDTDFCGTGAGGKAWTTWSDCASRMGYPTCEAMVANEPYAFSDAYWLINSVKLYQQGTGAA